MRFFRKSSLLDVVYHSAFEYLAPANITYNWNFGVIAFLCLIIQIVTGILLAMHYVSNIDFAFVSVEHIMRDVNHGWLLRYIHANGASMFFFVVYLHMFRGLYYESYIYPRRSLWVVGVIIFVLMIATAFIGYVLPWGQMSLWGATVITNLVSAIPYIGDSIVQWLWGGFAVDNATLNRFFSLHYLLPFALVGLVVIHFILLHETGSNNPLGVGYKLDNITFSPYFLVKDGYSVVLFLILFSIFIFFLPDSLGHPDNYIQANPLVTPTHIVPEWYFLWVYAILRTIPSKLGGLAAVVGALCILGFLPLFVSNFIGAEYKPVSKIMFWIFIVSFILLTWLGGEPIEEPYFTLSRIASIVFFLYFKWIFSMWYYERLLWLKSINWQKI